MPFVSEPGGLSYGLGCRVGPFGQVRKKAPSFRRGVYQRYAPGVQRRPPPLVRGVGWETERSRIALPIDARSSGHKHLNADA